MIGFSQRAIHVLRDARRCGVRDLPTGTITLLFTDIEGSTQLLHQLGDGYGELLAACRALLRSAFQEQRGHEVDMQGDAIFAVFARASDALSAAVAAQRALAAYSWPQGVAVRVRMGLHTGEPSRVTEGYVGLDVHRAARIMSAAHGGQVLLSQTARDLVAHYGVEGVSLRDLGEHRLKDFEQAMRLYQVVIAGLPADFPPLKTLDGLADTLPVPPTALVGREDEVAQIGKLLRREDVRLVTLTGPGGMGKSRLSIQVAAGLREVFVGGVFFVSLAPISDPMLVLPTIAQVLGIRDVAGQAQALRVVATLQRGPVLLGLDNFEQVVGAAGQVADLLVSCPRLKVLVTSREVLHVRAEHEFTVPPLVLPDPAGLPRLAALGPGSARSHGATPGFADRRVAGCTDTTADAAQYHLLELPPAQCSGTATLPLALGVCRWLHLAGRRSCLRRNWRRDE